MLQRKLVIVDYRLFLHSSELGIYMLTALNQIFAKFF